MSRGLLIFLLLSCGCTHIKLQRKTINQGSTLSAIQHQQVLDNLAMFACDPNALAWHVKVIGGVVQVADQGTVAAVPAAVGTAQLTGTLLAGRNVLEQWNVDTVIEPDDLELLQLAYQKAIDPTDSTRAIKKQVFEKIGELSATYRIVLSRPVAEEMIETMKIGASPQQAARLDAIARRLWELYRRMEELSIARPHGVGESGAAAVLEEIAAAKRELIVLIGSVGNQPFIAGYTLDRPQHCSAIIEQAETKISRLVDLVTDRGESPNPFITPWVSRGCKGDVPRCACYVGHYHGCDGDCYVWVLPEHARTLRDFTLTVLGLVPPDVQDATAPRLGVGAAFSPGSN
jgi:hypothetical protein